MKKPPKGIGLYITTIKSGKEKYQSRLWNPYLKRIGLKKTWQEKKLSTVIKLHLAFKAEYEENDFNIIRSKKDLYRSQGPVVILNCAGYYEKFLRDDPELVLPHQAKNRGSKYIKDSIDYIRAFLICLKQNKYNLSHTHILAVDDDAVAIFYSYLENRYENGEIGEVTWNKHFKACIYWFRFLQQKEIVNSNPFESVQLKRESTDPQFAELKELDELFEILTPENGEGSRGDHTVNHYRTWLKSYILISVFIGGRPAQIVNLKWSQWNGDYVILDNTKVNNARNEKSNRNYVYVHPELAELLSLLNKEASSDEDYILVPEYKNRKILQNFVSRAFKHYWRQIDSKKDLSINNLRHTYINALYNAIGEEGLSVHNKKETAIRHYLSKKKKLELEQGKSLFNINVEETLKS